MKVASLIIDPVGATDSKFYVAILKSFLLASESGLGLMNNISTKTVVLSADTVAVRGMVQPYKPPVSL